MTTTPPPELVLRDTVVDAADGTLRTGDGGIYRYHTFVTSLDLYPHEPDRPILHSTIPLRAAWYQDTGVYVAYLAGCPVHRGADLAQLLEEVVTDLALASVYLTYCVDSRRYILRFGPFNLMRYPDRGEALTHYQSFIDQLLPLHPCSA